MGHRDHDHDSRKEAAMRVRSLVISSLLATVTACTGRSDVLPSSHPVDRPVDASLQDILTVGTPTGSVIVRSGSGSVLSSGEGQVAAPDGSRLYATTRQGTSTEVEVRDSSSGALLSRTSLEGRLEVRVASITGRTVALMPPLPAGVDPTVALPRARTTIVVADPTGGRAPHRYVLTGNYEPEAFAIDDTRLFLIQYLPALAPSAYRVTFLDLESGRVHPVFGRFDSPPERMPGVRLAQLFDPTAEQLYTLYTNEPAAHFHDHWQDASYGDREVSFVHVLNLRQGWAYCAGLPRALWGQPARAQALVPSVDGRSLFVVDAMRGLVTELNTRTMAIERTARVDLELHRGRTSAVMSPDGSTLYVGVGETSVVRIDPRTLDVLGRWELPADVTAMALSPDGARLYAAVGDHVAVVDTATGEAHSTLSLGPVTSILHVATP
jgi:hypothetical protein